MGFIRKYVYLWLALLGVSVPLTYAAPLPGVLLAFAAFGLFVLGWIAKMKAGR